MIARTRMEKMVSVICPTYNQARYMRQGLESILMQKTNFEIEILIGEDCSPDNTNEILAEYEAKYPQKISVFHRKENLKQSKNVYDLFMRSTGKYIIILDLDDYWTDENKLQKQVDFLETHDNYIGVSHYYELVDANGNLIESKDREIDKFVGKEFTLEDFLEEGFVYQTGTFLYRNIWKENKDWSILYKSDKTVVDLTVNLILLQRKPIFILNDSMSVYREVIASDALNFRSVCIKDKAMDYKQMSEQMEKLNAYFEGKINFHKMWTNIVLSYFKGMMKREAGNYNLRDWLVMYKNSSDDVKNDFKREIRQSLMRKVKGK